MRLDGKRCYLDSNAFIYYAEGNVRLGEPIRSLIDRAASGKLMIVTSELTLAEVLVLPLKALRPALADQYEQLLSPRAGFQTIPISRIILVEAARLRAGSALKLPDAIHLASALQDKCDVLITEDGQLRNSTAMKVLRISELSHPPPDPA